MREGIGKLGKFEDLFAIIPRPNFFVSDSGHLVVKYHMRAFLLLSEIVFPTSSHILQHPTVSNILLR